ncbi:MAG TPA: SUMF1/EgtB/PvdO family nonheme iron enzyme [Myxococcota bacterium]|nr:SUMF1/EgtB/PvdO family nonheme iron enzyme [Myxococcota bacterium]HOA14109.1 SUMF1/EgtB/PvdO family nonheme iron enzyme [Myxococcota bacterium]HOD00810.1 SUMF1/EgtB/PvdO family nonheme iron enzyme [Myxococcota bacterium]HOH77437.1 SUMF1/EgtB/PvdO family nonheme iron enzyme [Myxococcota bacterium]HPV04889.1 SUMF1/EgtB/PvdO family nonheme iron enzyme [Myxococcota bacterium]
MLGGIFTFLIIVLVAGVMTVAWFGLGFAELLASVRDFFINTDIYWITGSIAVAWLVAKIWNRITGAGTLGAFLQVCCIGFGLWFGLIPLINSNRTNADFKCTNDFECNWNAQCVRDFCVVPFRDEDTFIGKSEFTQGSYKAWLTRTITDECDGIGNERKAGECRRGVEDKVAARFQQVIDPARCGYLHDGDTPESALFINDDAPMPCIGKDDAAAICASLGGSLPTMDDYDWMFDDRKFSCKNTVMVGLDEFHGYAKVLKKREAENLMYGPGCGTGKFRRVCDKAAHGNNEEGLCDAFGNLAEWTADGGSIGGAWWNTASTMREPQALTGPKSWVGFRCVVPKDGI